MADMLVSLGVDGSDMQRGFREAKRDTKKSASEIEGIVRNRDARIRQIERETAMMRRREGLAAAEMFRRRQIEQIDSATRAYNRIDRRGARLYRNLSGYAATHAAAATIAGIAVVGTITAAGTASRDYARHNSQMSQELEEFGHRAARAWKSVGREFALLASTANDFRTDIDRIVASAGDAYGFVKGGRAGMDRIRELREQMRTTEALDTYMAREGRARALGRESAIATGDVFNPDAARKLRLREEFDAQRRAIAEANLGPDTAAKLRAQARARLDAQIAAIDAARNHEANAARLSRNAELFRARGDDRAARLVGSRATMESAIARALGDTTISPREREDQVAHARAMFRATQDTLRGETRDREATTQRTTAETLSRIREDLASRAIDLTRRTASTLTGSDRRDLERRAEIAELELRSAKERARIASAIIDPADRTRLLEQFDAQTNRERSLIAREFTARPQPQTLPVITNGLQGDGLLARQYAGGYVTRGDAGNGADAAAANREAAADIKAMRQLLQEVTSGTRSLGVAAVAG